MSNLTEFPNSWNPAPNATPLRPPRKVGAAGVGYDPPSPVVAVGARLTARTKKEAIWARVTGLLGQ